MRRSPRSIWARNPKNILSFLRNILVPHSKYRHQLVFQLRLSAKLYNAIAAWAEDDFRSVNGQIEYLLTECVKQRKKNGKYVSDELDKPLDIDIE